MTQRRIYLIDDDHFLLDMYAVKFKNAGHDVTAFSKGEDLLDALRAKPAPDAILLDIVMPGMDGFQILEKINEEKLAPAAKKIVLSNQGQDTDIDRAKSLGAAGYIVKASAIPSEVLEQTMKMLGDS